MNQNFDFQTVDGIIDKLGCRPNSIIGILQSVQEHYRYLPREIFPYLSRKLGISKQEYMVLQLSMKTFLLSQRANM